jgi:hypothetical protein
LEILFAVMKEETAITALLFSETDDGQLEIRSSVIRDGRGRAQLIKVAQSTFELFRQEILRQDYNRLREHNPPEPEA